MQEERLTMEEASQNSDAYNIQHFVSKMDTLAGLAIKYGVEVADIKKLNGLVTDHQMYALESVQIPMPGKHPPSPVGMNSPSENRVKSPCSSLSPAMTSLQGFYGLTSPKTNSTDDNVETAQVSGPQPNGVHEDQSFSVSKFLGNIDASNDVEVIIAGDGGETNRPDGLNSVRRRPKADSSDSILYMSDLENMSESCSNDLRRMRNSVTGDSAAGINMLGTLRKSSSTSNLRGWESSSSFWPSSGAAAKPDGLPRPMNAWRSKDA